MNCLGLRGILLGLVILFQVGADLVGLPVLKGLSGIAMAVYLVCVMRRVRWSRQAFLVVAVALSAYALAMRDDGWDLVVVAGSAGAFVIAFFIALSSLRAASSTSPAIRACGLYLASRTPSLRYLALALGGHMFSLMLNYGSIPLLGNLVEQSETGPDGTYGNPVRVRRMLLAIQRGFSTTLCWSPLAFSMAVGPTVVAGSSWEGTALMGAGAALLLGAVGWGVDLWFKPPRPPHAPPPPPPSGSWRSLLPLGVLLVVIFSAIALVQVATGLRTNVAVLLVVPLVSAGWIAVQAGRTSGLRAVPGGLRSRVAGYFTGELDGYCGEILLLSMAGYIGKLGGFLAQPLVTGHLIDLGALPPWMILAGLVLAMPLAGQLGMHPILAASLIGPLLPDAHLLGISPDLMLLAMCVGWAFGAVSCPFTATVLLVAVMGRVSALTVGWRWNGVYLALGGLAGLAYVLGMALLT